ncbi:hypothetical protein HDU96_001145 [Phlyctochytrium bullatum]|nr:hypothetical protein HDU96_001145 [Phlyctochytrium bullatum]
MSSQVKATGMLGQVYHHSGDVRQVNVDDFTNWTAFLALLEVTVWATIDSVLWTVVNILITAAFAIVAPFWFVMQAFIVGFSIPERLGIDNSAVTASTPNIYDEYLDALKANSWKLSDTLIQKLAGTEKFDYDLATFLLHLSALIYEPTNLIENFRAEWRNHIDDVEFLSVKSNFLVITFKGTSPFDLTEWLTDASMRKSAARNGVLPGLVHTGFYTNFGFPNIDLIRRPTLPIDREFAASLETGHPMDLAALWRGVDDTSGSAGDSSRPPRSLWNDCIYPHLLAMRSQFRRQTPNLWITGHSLGAATATIFSSTLLWKRSEIGMQSTVPTLNWDKYFKVHGAYTFGTPRVGDTDFQQAIQSALASRPLPDSQPPFQFYRIINANDIVCAIPGLSASFGAFLRLRKRAPLVHKFGRGGGSGSAVPQLKPAGVTLSDFQSVGVPVYVGFRDGRICFHDRTTLDVIGNMVVEVPASLWECVAESSTWLNRGWLLAVAGTGGVASLLRDHFPSEYLRNLNHARKVHPRGPEFNEHAHHF